MVDPRRHSPLLSFFFFLLCSFSMAFFSWASDALARSRPAGTGVASGVLWRNRDLLSKLAMSGRQAFMVGLVASDFHSASLSLRAMRRCLLRSDSVPFSSSSSWPSYVRKFPSSHVQDGVSLTEQSELF